MKSPINLFYIHQTSGWQNQLSFALMTKLLATLRAAMDHGI